MFVSAEWAFVTNHSVQLCQNKVKAAKSARREGVSKKSTKFDYSAFISDLWRNSIAEFDHNFKSPDLMTIIKPPNLSQPQSFVTPVTPKDNSKVYGFATTLSATLI